MLPLVSGIAIHCEEAVGVELEPLNQVALVECDESGGIQGEDGDWAGEGI